MSNGKNSGRTAVLSLMVLLALVVLVAAAALVFKESNSERTGAASTASSTRSSITTTPSSETSTPTTSSTTPSTPSRSTRTRPTGEPGSVIYQLTGGGQVVGAAYRAGDSMRVAPITGTPWQRRATVRDKQAQLTGFVVRGTITCTIMQGEELLASSTSNGGPFACRATLPR
ncbi:hypothetical protein [Gordonia zhaorongruii]|uniref:hypothetical protein n=1 Tax=Gordonia zhaorongruii TaxID=2597659 RepID=UPI0010476B1A|nr:hypothetical protein [Gordonia zhaorongruii]